MCIRDSNGVAVADEEQAVAQAPLIRIVHLGERFFLNDVDLILGQLPAVDGGRGFSFLHCLFGDEVRLSLIHI